MNTCKKDDKYNLICELYDKGFSISHIRKNYNIDFYTIKKALSKNNIKTRDFRKTNFDQKYFNVIDTERKAYWLGFILADGSVYKTTKCKNPNRLSLNISSKDRELLEILITDLKSSNIKIKDYTPKGSYSSNQMSRVDFNSTELCNDLSKYGIVQNKTGKEYVSDLIPDNLINHFVRGVFDGDGSVTYCKKRKALSISLTGNFTFLSQIQKILMNQCNLNKTSIFKNKARENPIYTLGYGGNIQLLRVYDFLYKDSTVFLNRKKEKFDLIVSN